MTYLHLKRHVSYGLIAGRAVFLDLQGDRYVALDPILQADLLALRAGDEPVLAGAGGEPVAGDRPGAATQGEGGAPCPGGLTRAFPSARCASPC